MTLKAKQSNGNSFPEILFHFTSTYTDFTQKIILKQRKCYLEIEISKETVGQFGASL
jgi:hypothetical protein